MAKSATGRWVSRVGASGGGKAYKKTRPGNFYGALAVIVILGLVATIFARYDYQHPPKNPAGIAPKIGTTWYAALRIQACGATLPALATDTTLKGQGMYALADGVIRISPASAADSGNNATLAQFGNEYPGLIISTTQMDIPKNELGNANPKTSYTNGHSCPSGTPDAGQVGKVTYAYWSTFGQKKATVTTNPATIKFAPELRLAIGFEPANVALLPPTKKTDDAVLAATLTSTTTTTIATVVPTTTTTVASGATTTTKPSSATTTTIKSTTTTTAPRG